MRNDIWQDLEKLGIAEVRRYINAFPYEPDYNLAQYGNMLVYYNDVRELFFSAGYTKYRETWKRATCDHRIGEYKIDDYEVWKTYLVEVGRMAQAFVKAHWFGEGRH